MKILLVSGAALALVLVLPGCGKESPAAKPVSVPPHQHIPPHHGTPVVLGNEEYHVELVLDSTAGELNAYILDGELENFIRVQQPSFEVVSSRQGREETLIFKAVANNATGETAGDTSQFKAQADWLRTDKAFDAILKHLVVVGNNYDEIKFNFPKGNDTDEKTK